MTLQDLLLLSDHIQAVETFAQGLGLAPTDKHAALKQELRQAIADAPRSSASARIVWNR